MKLKPYQQKAVQQMRNGCILCGGVGSGKSITAIAYYLKEQGYLLEDKQWNIDKIDLSRFKNNRKPLYIITTARKRDTLEWEGELTRFSLDGVNDENIHIDSWNNIKKYKDVKDAFFIFDEQRVVGYGQWAKSFIKISKHNDWILLSATPGDTWSDYIPVFIANGFYKNKTDFVNQHVVYSRYTSYPQIERYLNIQRLIRLRKKILVDMEYDRHTIHHDLDIIVDYDKLTYKDVTKRRWNIFEDKPIENASEYCQILRKIVNSDESRSVAVLEIMEKHERVIIFYTFDYELEILKSIAYPEGCEVAEWNGHKHQPIPDSKSWVYLVQYNAGAEGWNCILTDTIIFYSLNHSYKMTKQASGRIDRLNSPYIDLYYYHLKSRSAIDLAIARDLRCKRDFNKGKFASSQNQTFI